MNKLFNYLTQSMFFATVFFFVVKNVVMGVSFLLIALLLVILEEVSK